MTRQEKAFQGGSVAVRLFRVIVYYSFCKLLSRRKKMKRLQYSKERDCNPEGLQSVPTLSILLITTKKKWYYEYNRDK
jgi:hypothetical protein